MAMSVEEANQILSALEAKLAEVTARAADLQTERRKLSFAANTGDRKARAALDDANAASATADLEIENCKSAIEESRHRVLSAEREAQLERQAVDAAQAQEIGVRVAERGRRMDAAAAALFGDLAGLFDDLTELHSLGCTHPNHFQLQSLGTRALKTSLMGVPPLMRREFEHIAPRERRTWGETTSEFAGAVSRWAGAVSNRALAKSEEAA
jgi:hypothetical protein